MEKEESVQHFLDLIKQSRRGKFKVYIGMIAGVGKTFRMLQEAHQLLDSGVDVQVGYVETHGRTATEALLQGLPVIPRAKIFYKGKELEEMDLQAILHLHPEIVIVDELAHTNVEGSKHEKRWQDVFELLDAGINVISAVNIQHIESLNEEVKAIAGIEVKERIVSGSIIMLAGSHIAATDLLANMGSGASGMFETSMVAILVAAMCALIREYGGFDALLAGIHKVFKGRKGGQFGMGLLVGTMDIATANNTVAIVMANPIAKDMAEEYGITPRKAASILDTFSCIFQGIIPYGAQMLVAISAASELGYRVSAFQIMPKLFYPFLLFVSSMIFIFLIPSKKER